MSAPVNFTSKAIASGLSDTPLGSQNVTVTGNASFNGIVGATKDLPQFTPAGGAVHVFKLN